MTPEESRDNDIIGWLRAFAFEDGRLSPRCALPLGMLFLELVFKGATTGHFFPAVVFLVLFAIVGGEIIYLLSSLSSRELVNRCVRSALLGAAGVVFAVEYFVFKEFNVFYDLTTVTSGAGHAGGQFGDQIADLVLNPLGITMIVLFLLPAALAALPAPKGLAAAPAAKRQRIEAAAVGVAAHVMAFALVACMGAYGRVYTDRYSFPSSVENFGLAVSLRKELGAKLTGPSQSVSFNATKGVTGLATGEGEDADDEAEEADAHDDADAATDDTKAQGTASTKADAADSKDAKGDATKADAADSKSEKADTADSKTDATKDDAADDKADATKDAKDTTDADKDTSSTANAADSQKKTYGTNELDIDFAALAKKTDGVWKSLDEYVATQKPSSKNEMTGRFAGYNLIFISGEAFSAEAIRKDTTPTLYRMATKGIQFTDYYQPASAGTTGGEYENVFGMLPTDGGGSFKDVEDHNNEITIGWALNKLGYEGWAFHNNDYTYYDRNLTHNKIGYNHGFIGYGNGMEEWVESQWPQSDYEMIKGTFDNLYGDASPFNVYYMSVSGHSAYYYDSNAMSRKWWDKVEGLEYSEPVKAYLACNVDLDKAMEYLIEQLEEKEIADKTVIVIGADHFPYGLDNDGALGELPYLSELYGYNVETIMQRDHNRLIMWSGSLEDEDPIVVDEPTSSIDILPTLLNLFGVEWDSRLLPGRDVFSDREALVFDLSYNWMTDLGTYFAGSDTFVPVEGAKVPKGYVDEINAAVADKISYSTAVLDSDYYRHVFGDPKDVNAVNKANKEETTIFNGDPVLDTIAQAELRIKANAKKAGADAKAEDAKADSAKTDAKADSTKDDAKSADEKADAKADSKSEAKASLDEKADAKSSDAKASDEKASSDAKSTDAIGAKDSDTKSADEADAKKADASKANDTKASSEGTDANKKSTSN